MNLLPWLALLLASSSIMVASAAPLAPPDTIAERVKPCLNCHAPHLFKRKVAFAMTSLMCFCWACVIARLPFPTLEFQLVVRGSPSTTYHHKAFFD